MDQDMRENLNTPPEQDPVRPRPRKAKKPMRKLRLALRRAYQRSEPARALARPAAPSPECVRSVESEDIGV